MELEEYNG